MPYRRGSRSIVNEGGFAQYTVRSPFSNNKISSSLSDRDLLFHRLNLLSRVGDVAPYLFGRKAHRHGVVVDGYAEDRHDQNIPAERDDFNAAEILRTKVGKYRKPMKYGHSQDAPLQ